MKDKITGIFDKIDAARNIGEVDAILKTAQSLDKAGQDDFAKRLRSEFSKRARPVRHADGFTIGHIHPLDDKDLGKGYHITYWGPKA